MTAKNPKILDQFSDQLWRLNNLYWIIDKSGKRVKFNLNSSQERLYHGLWYRTAILKARQRGFTTFLDIFALDSCLFNPNFAAGIIAHTREDAEKIFETKVKYPYQNLPDGLRTAIAAKADRAREYTFTNGSSISVSTSFRSGTLQFLHVSEMGKIAAKYPDKAQEIVTGAFEAVPIDGMIAVESTAEGRAGRYYDIVEASRKLEQAGRKPTRLDFQFFFEPWHTNPDYVLADKPIINPRMGTYFQELEDKHKIPLSMDQKSWYIGKESTLGGDMLREYPSHPDEAFSASIEGAYFSRQMARARREKRITTVPHMPGVPVTTWWDIGRDTTSIWFTQDQGTMIHVIDYYQADGEGLAHYKVILDEWAADKGYYYAPCQWPHDMGDNVWAANKTKEQLAIEAGLSGRVLSRMSAKADGVEAVRRILGVCIIDEERCADGIAGLDAYRKEWDDRLGTWRDHPLHDWASHPADAFQQLGLYHETTVAAALRKPKARPVQKVSSRGWAA